MQLNTLFFKKGIKKVGKLAGWMLVTWVVFLMALRAVVSFYPDWIMTKLSQNLKTLPFTYEQIILDWHALGPRVHLTQLQFGVKKEKGLSIVAQKASVSIAPFRSLLARDLVIGQLALEEASILGDISGFSVGDTNSVSPKRKLPRLTPKEVVLKGVSINILDANQRRWHVDNVQAIASLGLKTRFNGTGDYVDEPKALKRFSVEFRGEGLLAQKEAILYFKLQYPSLSDVLSLENVPKLPEMGYFAAVDAKLEGELWLSLNQDGLKDLAANVNLKDLKNAQNQSPIFSGMNVTFLSHLSQSSHQVLGKLSVNREAKRDEMRTLFNLKWDNGELQFIEAVAFDLDNLNPLLALLDQEAHPDLEWLKMLKGLKPSGRISHLNLNNVSKRDEWEGSARIHQLGLAATQFNPEIEGLDTDIVINKCSGKIALKGKSVHFDYPNDAKKPLELKELSSVLNWHWDEKGTQIALEHFHTLFGKSLIEATAKWEAPWLERGAVSVSASHIDLILRTHNISVHDVVSYLPTHKLPKDGYGWIKGALDSGTIPFVKVLVKGNLIDFPYQVSGVETNESKAINRKRDEKRHINREGELSEILEDHSTGVFQIYATLNDVNLKYEPTWPSLDKIVGELLFNGKALTILVKDASITGVPVVWANAYIPDLSLSEPNLIIDSYVDASLAQGQEFVQLSPLKKKLGRIFSVIKLNGPMRLDLNLFVPLGNTIPIGVNGLIQTEEAHVGVKAHDLEVNHLKGVVSFTENGVYAKKLEGLFLEDKAQFQLHTHEDKGLSNLHVIADSSIQIQKLQNYLKLPSLKGLIEGTLPYNMLLDFPITDEKANTVLHLVSDFKGVKLAAPYPFGKDFNDKMPSKLSFVIEPNDVINVNAAYDDVGQIKFNLYGKEGKRAPKGMNIHFGQAQDTPYKENDVLRIDGEISYFSVSQWQAFGENFAKKMGFETKGNINPSIDLKIDHFDAMGFALKETTLFVESDAKAYQVRLSGPSVQGHVQIPQNESMPIVADLEHLNIIVEDKGKEKDKTTQINLKPEKLRGFHFKSRKVHLGDKDFQDIQLVLTPDNKRYQINPLVVNTYGSHFEGKGVWGIKELNPYFSLNGSATIHELGDTLRALGYAQAMKGKGVVALAVEWSLAEKDTFMSSLKGTLGLELRRGVVTDVNPGLGRVLGLLNVDNLPRRMQLDFTDLLGKGFAFDQVLAKAHFNQGVGQIEKFTLKGPAADIDAQGHINVVAKLMDIQLMVTPHLSGAVPVAATVATGNIAIGAAIWAIDKVFGSPISNMLRFKYQINGSWPEPKVIHKGVEQVKQVKQ